MILYWELPGVTNGFFGTKAYVQGSPLELHSFFALSLYQEYLKYGKMAVDLGQATGLPSTQKGTRGPLTTVTPSSVFFCVHIKSFQKSIVMSHKSKIPFWCESSWSAPISYRTIATVQIMKKMAEMSPAMASVGC